MTNYIIGERCSGKTTRLIERSAKEGIYILVPTKNIARCVADQAKEMELDIPFPVTVREYLNGDGFRWSDIRKKGLLIDELDLVLERLFRGIPVHEVTLTDRGNVEQLESLIEKSDGENTTLEEMIEIEQTCKRETKGEKGMKLKDLLKLFISKHHLRINIDGEYICDTTSDSAIVDLYQDCPIILVEQRYEMRDDLAYLYLEVWLKKE